jgi:hypothetical protein
MYVCRLFVRRQRFVVLFPLHSARSSVGALILVIQLSRVRNARLCGQYRLYFRADSGPRLCPILLRFGVG